MSQELKGTLNNSLNLNGSMQSSGNLRGQFQLGGGGGGTTDYEDLSNKPSINGHTLEGDSDTADLQLDYEDLLNKPVIPDMSGYYDKVETDALLDTKFNKSDVVWQPVVNQISVAIVNRELDVHGNYQNKVTNKGIGPFYTEDETDTLLAAKANTEDLATVATSGDYDELINKPALATVATTGDYDDLIDKPVIPLVGKKAVIHQLHLGSTAVTTSAGALYVSSNRTTDISSYGFTSVDACIPMGWNATGTAASWVALQAFSTTDINYLIYRHSSMTFTDYYVSFLIIGD